MSLLRHYRLPLLISAATQPSGHCRHATLQVAINITALDTPYSLRGAVLEGRGRQPFNSQAMPPLPQHGDSLAAAA